MQDMSQPDAMQEQGQESPPPSFEEGYRITITVSASGYEVEGPEPLAPEPSMPDTSESEPAESLPDLTTALKHVLAIVKEHPVAQDEQQSFTSATSDMPA